MNNELRLLQVILGCGWLCKYWMSCCCWLQAFLSLLPRKWLESSKWPLLGIPGRQWRILMEPLGSKKQAVLLKRVHYNASSHCVHIFPSTENWIHDNNTLLYGTVQYKGKVYQYNTSSIQSFHKCCAVSRNVRSGRPGEQQRNCGESC